MALSSFESSPCEVLEQIVFWLVTTSFLGPPADIISLLLLSKRFWNILALHHNRYLYARIFALKFDIRAPLRRIGRDGSRETRHLDLSVELIKRFRALKRLRRNNYDHLYDAAYLRVDLWTAYTMFLESDVNNSRQLIEYARLDLFALNYVQPHGLLHHGSEQNGGWTVDTEENALALWLFWFTDKERVLSESPSERQEILRMLAPLFVGSFKYPSTHAPITSFHTPSTISPRTSSMARVLSLATAPIASHCQIPSHFGLELTLARPPIMPPALLSCVVRFEASIAAVNWPLPDYIPATRADAVAVGWHGPTQEDRAKQKVPTTRFMEWDVLDMASERHHHDWMRLQWCYDTWDNRTSNGSMFTPGMLHGQWVGKWFGIPVNESNDLLRSEQTNTATTSHPPTVYSVPMQFYLKEHYQGEPHNVVDVVDLSRDGTGKGAFNAWLPDGTSFAQIGDKLQVYAREAKKPSTYQTYRPHAAAATSQPSPIHEQALNRDHPYGDGILDIILTAETDEHFAAAWGHKRFYGRVRAWDGLIVLVRAATETEGQWIFRGYLHGMQNLVGLWRETGTPINVPAWEGVWSMAKVDDGF